MRVGRARGMRLYRQDMVDTSVERCFMPQGDGKYRSVWYLCIVVILSLAVMLVCLL
jgi:hypothetical protein